MAHNSMKMIRRRVGQLLLRASVRIVPWIYSIYMAGVWKTSRIREAGVDQAVHDSRTKGGIAIAVYHETVLLALQIGRRGKLLTVASRSDSGEVISAVIEHYGMAVLRGGSSRSRRRRTPVLREVIDYVQAHGDVIAALTVDGSYGPRRKLKPGILEVARAAGVPLYAMHVHPTWALRLPTWDRTLIPLPFGRIHIVTLGPVWISADQTPEQHDQMKERVQTLMDTAADRAEQGRIEVLTEEAISQLSSDI